MTVFTIQCIVCIHVHVNELAHSNKCPITPTVVLNLNVLMLFPNIYIVITMLFLILLILRLTAVITYCGAFHVLYSTTQK